MIRARSMPSPVARPSALGGGRMAAIAAVFLFAALLPGWTQSNLAEQIRTACLQGRHRICGRVMQMLPDGLVVDSGYLSLLNPPFNHSWVVPASVSPVRNASLVEEKTPDAAAIGLVFLANIPKRPGVKLYDYVVIRGYPAGTHLYTPVAGVNKSLRCFSASLERAVQTNLPAGQTSSKNGPGTPAKNK